MAASFAANNGAGMMDPPMIAAGGVCDGPAEVDRVTPPGGWHDPVVQR